MFGELVVLTAGIRSDGEPAPFAAVDDTATTTEIDIDARALPVHMRMMPDSLVCERRDGDGATPIHYLTFERAGDRSAYGAYGLQGPKNGLPVDRPLTGDPVTWPERDAEQALGYVLALGGLAGDAAANIVAERSAAWLGDGLRAFFVLPLPLESEIPGFVPPAGARVLLIRLELANTGI